MKTNRSDGLDAGMVIWGLLIGFAIGAIFGLLNAPRSGSLTRKTLFAGVTETEKSLRTRLENVVPADPVAESIAEGKAAAARRRAELGLGSRVPN